MTDRQHVEPSENTAWTIEHVAVTGSTQADLIGRAERGEMRHRSVRSAGHQTAGRGRHQRRWEAPPGSNLLVSLGFVEVPDDPGVLMRRTALAVAAVCDDHYIDQVALKWPNDVMVGENKIAGLLAQRTGSGAVVVGVGLNVGWAPPHGTSLDAAKPSGERVGVDAALAALLEHFDALAPPEHVESLYRRRLGTIGSRVRVQRSRDTVVGVATDVGSRGELHVVDDRGVGHVIDAGDVEHLRRVD